MPRPSNAVEQLPASVLRTLQALGENLALARQRRGESLRARASRMGVSVPTLSRMEKGDPAVGMGVYATALWLMGQHQALADIAAPQHDLGALELDIQAIKGRRLFRKVRAGEDHER